MTRLGAAVAETRPAAPVGGFFERHDPDPEAPGASVLEAWTCGRPHAAFVNARSAFAALTRTCEGAAVWLPAFICVDMVDPAIASRVRFYPVLEGFVPDLARVVAEAGAGDLVLVVAYFGLPFSQSVRDSLARRPDLRVVEDCAQALAPGCAGNGWWTLYSPRKLLGVADGGLLVGPDQETPVPQPDSTPDSEALWRAPLMRRQDPQGADNAAWHAANQAKEAAMGVTSQAMSDRSLSILSGTALEGLAVPRLANWRRLDRSLRPWSALPAEVAAPPLGYVLRLDPMPRDRLLRGLHAERIFAAVHWPKIAAPAESFPREAAWTRELVTLPCDHRYGEAAMDRIADLASSLLQ